MKKYIRITINLLMTCFFIFLMGYQITGNAIHEYVGVVTLLLMIIHNILNIRWYKNLFKGKYNFQRIIYTIIDFLLLIDTIVIAVSSMIISSNVFSFLNIPTTMLGRRLHLLATSWGFVLMSAHIGLHLNVIVLKAKEKLKNSTFEYVFYFLLSLIVIYGVYAFINSNVWKNMILLNDFNFFDFDKSVIIFYLEYIAMLIFVSFIIYGIFTIIKSLINKLKKGGKK